MGCAALAVLAMSWYFTGAPLDLAEAAAGPAPRVMVRAQGFTVGLPVRFDASLSGSAFSDPRRRGLHYEVRFAKEANGLVVEGSTIRGIPRRPAVLKVTIVARDLAGDSAVQHFPIVIFSRNLSAPLLPDSGYPYSDQRVPLPRHFLQDVTGSVVPDDNTPAGNRVTEAGATLGRVLFYDRRLSGNDRVSCASCHQQRFGFADTARFSRGLEGALTARHTMALVNTRFYQSGRFFRDERAATLEQQVLQPMRSPSELGLPPEDLVPKLELTPYYPRLFLDAFGSEQITPERIAKALSQFVRSLTSTHSRLDQVFRGNGPPNLSVLTPEEWEGRRLFTGPAGCARCHRTNALNMDLPSNIGLDSVDSDPGAGQGKFKTSSLRNVAIRPPYMHDGRFRSLREVVDFYDHGIQNHPYLDPRLRGPDGGPLRLHLTVKQRAALIAYLATFTDTTLLHDVRFSDPFRRPRKSD